MASGLHDEPSRGLTPTPAMLVRTVQMGGQEPTILSQVHLASILLLLFFCDL